MRTVDLIRTKRDGGELSREEIDFFLQGCVQGSIPDYQASALLMAVFFSGMTEEETLDWTESMLQMAAPLDLSDLPGAKIGQHSTGGVGDKTRLIVGPLAAAAGVTVPMIVGRGLSHTGGTLDKFESIPGFNARLKPKEFKAVLGNVKLAVIGQSDELAPADRKLYALRNATATAASVPLIAASILSRTLAEGTDGVVVDVKTGSGSLVSKIADARRLAQLLAAIGKRKDKKVVGLVTDMDQPLGYAIGNALEVMEAVQTLKGGGPQDLTELSLELASRIVCLADPQRTLESAKDQCFKSLSDGTALKKFRQLVEVQGGNAAIVDSFELLPTASAEFVVSSPRAGYVSRISADDIGQAAAMLGAGRTKMEAEIDAGVGIVLEHKVGDHIQSGERLCTIYYNEATHLEEATQRVEDAFHISSAQSEASPLVYEVVQ